MLYILLVHSPDFMGKCTMWYSGGFWWNIFRAALFVECMFVHQACSAVLSMVSYICLNFLITETV